MSGETDESSLNHLACTQPGPRRSLFRACHRDMRHVVCDSTQALFMKAPDEHSKLKDYPHRHRCGYFGVFEQLISLGVTIMG